MLGLLGKVVIKEIALKTIEKVKNNNKNKDNKNKNKDKDKE